MQAFRFPRRPIIALMILGVTIIVGDFIVPRHSRADAPLTTSSTEVSALRQQKIDTFQEASDEAHEMYKKGVIGNDQVFPVDRLLIEAKLEAATTVDDRVRLLGQELELSRKEEAYTETLMQQGKGSSVQYAEAKANRLDVEIKLAELKSK